MPPKLSEDEIDDLLYFARTGDKPEFHSLTKELSARENVTVVELLEVARDEDSGNGALHMAAANGHESMSHICLTLSEPFYRYIELSLIRAV
jgi:hypothetical protein